MNQTHFDRLISGEPAEVYKPDGSLLLRFLPNAIPKVVCEQARPALRKAGSRFNDHRGHHGDIIGYYDLPTCRRTHYTNRNVRGWLSCLPFIRAVNSVFQRELPDRYAVQRRAAKETPAWAIADTAFTTVTVNLWDAEHDARTPVHTDAGDLPEGFGVISVLSKGQYSGGYLCFPKYRVAVDMRTTDVLLCDVHEAHGNVGITDAAPGWERVACVFYYRTTMRRCR